MLIIKSKSQESNSTPEEKEKYKYLGFLKADSIKQAETKKSKKKIHQENEISSRN